MSDPDELESEVERARASGLDLADVDLIIAAVVRMDGRFATPKRPLGLTPIDWKPHLVSSDNRVCHVHAVDRLGSQWIQRMRGARRENLQVVIAAPLSSWHSDNTLLTADELNAQAIILSQVNRQWRAKWYRSIGQLIAREKLLVAPTTLKGLGTRMLARARAMKGANARGHSFEDFLAFLFSQVPEFDIFEQDYHTATEEIDLVIKNRNTHARAWPPNAPLVLVSGKNRKDVVGAPSVTSLASKVENRRKMCRLGFLCTSGGISRDAREHELRFSKNENVLVLVDGTTLDRLVAANDLPAELEKLVIDAALR